jgi:hypothetical protein
VLRFKSPKTKNGRRNVSISRAPHRLTQKFALAMDALKIDCTLHGLRHTHVSQS